MYDERLQAKRESDETLTIHLRSDASGTTHEEAAEATDSRGRRYAARFEGAHSARLHHAVRRLREANGTRARVLQPEALAAELGMPTRCVDMWWRDPRCEAEGAHAEIRPSS